MVERDMKTAGLALSQENTLLMSMFLPYDPIFDEEHLDRLEARRSLLC